MKFTALFLVFGLAGCTGGFTAAEDLLDTDAADDDGTDLPTNAGGAEDCADGIDNNGDSLVDCADPQCLSVCDADGDGSINQGMGGDDCDDANAAVHPGAVEICDDLDNDCDTLIDDEDDDLDVSSSAWYADFDLDGYGNDNLVVYQCEAPPGDTVQVGGDCDDADPSLNPGAPEICDGVDNNCDLLVDDADPALDPAGATTYYIDADADGYGDPLVSVVACSQPFGYVDNGLDCDDNDPLSATGFEYWPDLDNDGYGAGVLVNSCTAPAGHVLNGDDCDDADPATFPGAYDACGDLIDRDCDGQDCAGGNCGVVPFAQPSYNATVTFTEATALESTRMTMTWDGVEYWASSGGSPSGNRVANHNAAGVVLNYFQPGIDMRAVFTMGDGTAPVYGRGYGSNSILQMTAPGSFANFVTLVGGSLDSQAAIAWDDTNAEFVAANNGTVYMWNIAGTNTGSVSLVGWGVGTETSYPQNRGVAWACDHYLTYADGTLSAWDMTTGIRVATTTLTGAGTSFDSYFSFSYADGLFFVLDASGGTWRGYEVF